MSIYEFDLFSWIAEQDPDSMPFRPGVSYTEKFGLRTDPSTIEAGGSPGHLGVDRGSTPRHILMPFDGEIIWEPVGGVAGSVLHIIPIDQVPVEIQIFHSRRIDGRTGKLRADYSRGNMLPVYASDLGFSLGPHTHTEVVVQYTPWFLRDLQLRYARQCYYSKGLFDNLRITEHCDRYGINRNNLMDLLREQIDTWGIEELWGTFAVRSAVPEYRVPHWGTGATLHLSSEEFLQI